MVQFSYLEGLLYLIPVRDMWYTHTHIFNVGPLTFSIWSFKSQVSAVARALFNLNAHCGTVLFLFGERDVHLMEHCCPIQPLKVKKALMFFILLCLR
jgi:hypothetical protein